MNKKGMISRFIGAFVAILIGVSMLPVVSKQVKSIMLKGLTSIKNTTSGIMNTVDKTYTTHRKPEHFMRKFNGFGISEDILSQLVSKGIDNIIIIYHGKIKAYRYTCSITQFLKSTKVFDNKENGITDPQKFVSITDMDEKEIIS